MATAEFDTAFACEEAGKSVNLYGVRAKTPLMICVPKGGKDWDEYLGLSEPVDNFNLGN